VILFAYREISFEEYENMKSDPENIEKDLTFLGLFGMIDPLKNGVV
jgi:magnesium-transporting ATPase (P-type)